MNARGSTEVIVASIGLSMGALSQDLFTMIVAMAVVTTMEMLPTLRWTLSRLPLRSDERVRLERHGASRLMGRAAVADLVIAVVQGRTRIRQRGGEACLALDQRQRAEIFSVEV